jgi:hypothetical protein
LCGDVVFGTLKFHVVNQFLSRIVDLKTVAVGFMGCMGQARNWHRYNQRLSKTTVST